MSGILSETVSECILPVLLVLYVAFLLFRSLRKSVRDGDT